MKTLIFGIAIIAATVTACGNNEKGSTADNKSGDTATATAQTANKTNQQGASADEAVTAYLQLKNALAKDNGNEAAAAGKQLQEATQKLDNASFTAEQKKVYDEVKDDIKEHAEHIGSNADKLAHQREHFDVLSQDMYDLVKVAKPSQTLYKVHCPMFNDNKGADWLSETKGIKNPYYGKKMLTCGEVKEEIKQ